jgi:trans-aconitate 2-methyltransferase
MTAPRFDQSSYRPDPTRRSNAHAWAESHLAGKSGLSVLEIGCATGQDLAPALRIFPQNRFVGLDISEVNIREAAKLHPGSKWIAADYMVFSEGRFDLIISERSLSVFECSDDVLAGKLASDLVPGGLAVVTLPASCLCTTAHFTLKSILRGLRSKPLDSFFLWLAQRLRPGVDKATLADRVIYMYVVPLRIAGRKFYDVLARHGLTIEQDHGVMRCTPFETPHRLLVLRKAGS